ncbi:MAG TPA: hypothetical protein VGK19_20170 [Capsulimonadaceae bacterium]
MLPTLLNGHDRAVVLSPSVSMVGGLVQFNGEPGWERRPSHHLYGNFAKLHSIAKCGRR